MNLTYIVRAHVPMRYEEPAALAAARDAAGAGDALIKAAVPLGDGLHSMVPAVTDVELVGEDVVALLPMTERERSWLESSLGRIVAGYDDEPARGLFAKLQAIDLVETEEAPA